jgi:hypothetical protein
MDVKRIERVSNLVRYPSRQQRERIQSLGFDRFLCRASALGDVAQNHGMTNLLRCSRRSRAGNTVPASRIARFDYQWHDVKIDEPIRGIKNLHIPADWSRALRQ